MSTIKDHMWLWGTIVNVLQEHYHFDTSKMTIGQGLEILGLDHAMMCGNLPPTEEEYEPVKHCPELLWEMSFDEGFEYKRQLAPIAALHEKHPSVKAVLLDDFSTTEISQGAQPSLLADMRRDMPKSLELWIVVYTMNMDIPNLEEYLEYVDGISFWVWHAKELPQIPEHVARLHEMTNRKPTVVGAYFYDFGEMKPLTNEEMGSQIEIGVEMMAKGDSDGLCFLSSSIMDVGLDSVGWTRDWIAANGDQPFKTRKYANNWTISRKA